MKVRSDHIAVNFPIYAIGNKKPEKKFRLQRGTIA